LFGGFGLFGSFGGIVVILGLVLALSPNKIVSVNAYTPKYRNLASQLLSATAGAGTGGTGGTENLFWYPERRVKTVK
jgi:hypothetical protein